MRTAFQKRSRAEKFRADYILAQKLTRLRLALAQKAADETVSFALPELNAFLDNLEAIVPDRDLFLKEVENVRSALADENKAKRTPDLSRPELQLLWAAALLHIERTPQTASYGHGGMYTHKVDVSTRPVWRQAADSPVALDSLNKLGGYVREELRRKDTRYVWGKPGSGFHYDTQQNTINADFLMSLIGGLEHAHAVILREVGKDQLSTRFPKRNQELSDAVMALKAREEAGQKLNDREYKAMRKMALEWEMRERLWKATEGVAANRYVANKGLRASQDYGYSLNHYLMTNTPYGVRALDELRTEQTQRTMLQNMARQVLDQLQTQFDEASDSLPPEDREALQEQMDRLTEVANDPLRPEQRFMNILQAIELSFYRGNNLFDHNRHGWEQFGIRPDDIRITDPDFEHEAANDNRSGSLSPDFLHLLELCNGKQGLEHIQPRRQDLWFGRAYFNSLNDRYADRRNEITERIWDLYIADIANELMHELDRQLDDELKNRPPPQTGQQNQQQDPQNQQGQQNQQPQKGSQQKPQQDQPGPGDQQDQNDGDAQDDPNSQPEQSDSADQAEPEEKQDGQDGQDGQQGRDGEQPDQGDQSGEQDGSQPGQDGDQPGSSDSGDGAEPDSEPGTDGQPQPGQQDRPGESGQDGDQPGSSDNGAEPDSEPVGDGPPQPGQKDQPGEPGTDGQPGGEPQEPPQADGDSNGAQQQRDYGPDEKPFGDTEEGEAAKGSEPGDDFDPQQAGTDQTGKKTDVINNKGEEQKMPDVEVPPKHPEGHEPGQDADGQQADGQDADGKDAGEGAPGKTLEEIQKALEEAEKAQQDQDGQGEDADGQEADGQEQDSQGEDADGPADDGPGKDGQPGQPGQQPGQDGQQGDGEGDTPSKSAGDGGEPKSLEDIAKMEWKSYPHLLSELRPYINKTGRILQQIRDRQFEKTIKRSSVLEMLPEDKDLGRLNDEAHRNLRLKYNSGQPLEKEDFNRFHRDKISQKPTTIDIVLLIDGSGSMTAPNSLHGQAKAMEIALVSAIILYEAAKAVEANVYIALWGNDEPLVLAKPGDDQRTIEENILKARSGLNSGTNLAPSIKKITRTLAEHKSGKYSGYTHMMVISDGDITDVEPGAKAINALMSVTDYVTMDFAIIEPQTASTMPKKMEEAIDLVKAGSPTQKIGVHKDGNPESIPAGIVGLILQKIRSMDSFTAVPWSRKRKQFQRAQTKLDMK